MNRYFGEIPLWAFVAPIHMVWEPIIFCNISQSEIPPMSFNQVVMLLSIILIDNEGNKRQPSI